MQEETDYKGIYLVSGKYIEKATLNSNGYLLYVPRKGAKYHFAKDSNEEIGKLNFAIVKDYGDYYKEYATDLPIAKGKHYVPIFIDEDAELKPIEKETAEKFISKSKKYKNNFYKLYASGANNLYDYYNMQSSKKTGGHQKKKTR